MNRVKTFDSTGVAPGGRLYAADLNSIQDAAAALTDLAQNISVGTIKIGEVGLILSRLGAGEAQISGAFRSTGILRGDGGLMTASYTTTTRNAIGAGLAPTGLVIWNSTTVRYEVNIGTDGARNWSGFGLTTVNTADLVDGSVTNPKLASSAVDAAKVAASLKPSGSAAVGTEALRALGTTPGTALAGDAAVATPVTTTTAASKTNGQTHTITAPVAGTYVLEFGAGYFNAVSQGNSCTATSNLGGTFVIGNPGSSSGMTLKNALVLTAGQVITITYAIAGGSTVFEVWAKLTRTA